MALDIFQNFTNFTNLQICFPPLKFNFHTLVYESASTPLKFSFVYVLRPIHMLVERFIIATVSLSVCISKCADRWMELRKIWYWRILQKKKNSNDFHHHFTCWSASFSARMPSLVPVRPMRCCVHAPEILCFPHISVTALKLIYISYHILF